MAEKVVIEKWVAEDGTEHNSEAECQAYERKAELAGVAELYVQANKITRRIKGPDGEVTVSTEERTGTARSKALAEFGRVVDFLLEQGVLK